MSGSENNPFVGLRSFESDESLLFFGRREQSLELLQRLHEHHFVAVVGSSGSGKSSVIKAGLIPALKAGYLVMDRDKWVISVMKPGQSPLCNLADAILDPSNAEHTALTSTELEQQIKEEGADAILNILQSRLKDDTSFFLLVDQFEELFRFSFDQQETGKKDEATDFVNILLELSENKDLPVYVVITMRSDFIGDCAQFYGLPEAINQSQYLVPRLNRTQLKSIIEGPVRLYKGAIDYALTTRLLNDVQLVHDELPLLQHVMMRIWDREVSTDKNGQLSLNDYESIGGIEKALSNHADEALLGMSDEELKLTKKIFQALTSIDPNGRKTRRPVRLSELEEVTGTGRDNLLPVINRFIEGNRSFLIITGIKHDTDSVIDISHESLIRQWSTLSGWVAEEADSAKILLRLNESAELFSHKEKNLLVENELHQVLHWHKTFMPSWQWAQRYGIDYKRAISYLQQSEKEEKRQRLRKRRNQAYFIAASIIVFLLISAFALYVYENNVKNKRELALSYWKSSQSAKVENNLLDALHFVAEAGSYVDDRELFRDMLTDGEVSLPYTGLKNMFLCNDIINSVDFSSNNKWILTGSNDGSTTILDRETGKLVGKSLQSNGPVNNAVFSPDNRWVLTASNDKTATVWEVVSGKKNTVLKHNKFVTYAAFSPDGKLILTACADSCIRVWERLSGKQVYLLKPGFNAINVIFSPDGKQILAAGAENLASLWNIATQKNIATFNLNALVTAIGFNPSGSKVLTAGNDSTLYLWNAANGARLNTMKMSYFLTNIAYSPGGRWIAASGSDKMTRLYDTATLIQAGPSMKQDGLVYSFAFSPNQRWLATAGGDKTVRVWELPKIADPVKEEQFVHTSIVNSAVFSPDEKLLADAGNDSIISIWNVASAKQTRAPLKHNHYVNTVRFNADGSNILSASSDSTAAIWNVSTGKQVAMLQHPAAVFGAVYSPDYKRVVTSCGDSCVRIWDIQAIPTVKFIDSFRTDAAINTAVFSPDMKSILVSSENNEAYIVDVASRKKTAVFTHTDQVKGAVFNKDGRWVLTASWDNTARLWDAATGSQIGPSMKHDAYVTSAVFNYNESGILTTCWDMSVHLWSTATLKQIGMPVKHPNVPNSAAYSSNGKWILTSCRDHISRIWEMPGDLDLSPYLFRLQAKALTGVQYNVSTSETQCMPVKQWYALKQEYDRRAREHYKTCKYPQYNLWRRFNPSEAKSVSPG